MPEPSSDPATTSTAATADAGRAAPAARAGPAAWIALAVLMVPVLMTAVDMAVLFLAMRTVAADLLPAAPAADGDDRLRPGLDPGSLRAERGGADDRPTAAGRLGRDSHPGRRGAAASSVPLGPPVLGGAGPVHGGLLRRDGTRPAA